jgi:hypothetical protein
LVKKRLPVVEALLRHPGAFLLIIALRLCELLTMYIVGLKLLRFGHTVTDPQRNQDQRHAEQEG